MTERIPWRRIAAEAALIVIPILLALAADAWWDFRQDRAEEKRTLDAVASELREARRGFEAHLGEMARQDELVRRILTEVRTYSGSARLLDTLLFRLGPFDEFVPPLAAFKDATASGSLSLIRSDSIRRMLGRYEAVLSTDLLEQRVAREHFHSQMAPVWLQYVNVRDHVGAGHDMGRDLLPEDGLPDLPFPSLYQELLADRRFSNQLVERSIYTSRVRAFHRRAIQTIDDILAVLDRRRG